MTPRSLYKTPGIGPGRPVAGFLRVTLGVGSHLLNKGPISALFGG